MMTDINTKYQPIMVVGSGIQIIDKWKMWVQDIHIS